MANVTACGAVAVEEELVGGVAPPMPGEEPEPVSEPWEDYPETYASSVGGCNPSLGVSL